MTDTALRPDASPAIPVAIRPGAYVRIIAMRLAMFIILAGGAVWLAVNFVHSPTQFFNSAILGLSNGALYALIALGYTLVYGIIGLINFAHGDLFMLGTLCSGFLLTTVLGQTTSGAAAWGLFLLTVVATMAFCGSVNVAIEFLAYRRLRRAPKLAPLITAVGMSFVLQQIGLWWNGSTQKSWPSVLPTGGLRIGAVAVDYTFLIVVAVTVPLLLVLTWVVTKTKQGKAMRATAQGIG